MDVTSYLLGKQAGGGGGSTGNYTLAIDVSSPPKAYGLASKITEVSPTLDTSQLANFSYFFANSSVLTKIPELNTSNATTITQMFNGCTNLTTIPVLDFSNVTTAGSVYQGCPNFTDQTLDNILVSLSKTKLPLTFQKTLSEQGFKSSNYPAERIQALPHYQDFINAGWKIGY